MQRDTNALIAFIESRNDTPHEWGRDKNDCVGFVLDAVKAQTGEDRVKLKWKDQKSGLRTILSNGGLETAFDRHFQRIPSAHAHRGDIAGVADPDLGVHPMIVEGATLVSPGDRGNFRVPRSAMEMAWSATLPKPKKSKK